MTSKLDPIENRWFREQEELESIMTQNSKVDHPSSAVLTIPHWPENILEAISRLMNSVARVSDRVIHLGSTLDFIRRSSFN
jgi:hypothetical protein